MHHSDQKVSAGADILPMERPSVGWTVPVFQRHRHGDERVADRIDGDVTERVFETRMEDVAVADNHIPDHLLSVVVALRALTSETRTSAERDVRDHLVGMSTLALRELGFTDAHIAQQFGCSAKTISTCARGIDFWMDRHTGRYREICDHWDRARRNASPWYQVDSVSESCDVVTRHSIETPDWPLRIEALDLPAVEIVHQRSGERIVVYSLQRWKGTPCPTATNPVAWDMVGSYQIEFISAAGERGSISPELLDLPTTRFAGDEPSRRRGRDGYGVYHQILLAMRRRYGVLPPYDSAFGLYVTHSHAS